MSTSPNVIYLDNNSTTPTDPRVVEAMLPYFTSLYGNAASTHRFGTALQRRIGIAREQVSSLINCEGSELIFTSGATESINIGIIGYALKNSNKGKHLITVRTEHRAVLDTFSYLESIGFETTLLEVDELGRLDLSSLIDAIRQDTVLVSVMLSNNETGVIHPIQKIAEIVHRKNCSLFCDATQSAGKMPINVNDLAIDMLSFSAHKFYGPKGVGALFVKELKRKPCKIQAIQFGGGQEQGIRSGTLNVPGIIGFAKACELAIAEMAADKARIQPLRDSLENELLTVQGSFVNGEAANRVYNVTNICFPGVDANALISRVPDICMANGSACTAAIVEPSHVLTAMGLSDENSNSSLRLSLGKFNTKQEVDRTLPILKELILNDLARYAKVS